MPGSRLARGLTLLLLASLFTFTLVWSRREARALRALSDEVDAHVLIPPQGAVRLVSLGYNQLLADLYWVRTLVYYGDGLLTQHGMPDIRQLLLAINTLDPQFRRPYAWGAQAVTFRQQRATQEEYRMSVEVLRRGMAAFPDDWELAWTLGLRLFLDLKSDDAAEQRAWKEEGAAWMERAMRMPRAPADLPTLAATMRSKLGQKERALRELREMILTTSDARAREKLIDRYAALAASPEASAAIQEEADRFEREWKAALPYAPPSFYLMLGPPPAAGFNLEELGADKRSVLGPETADPAIQ